MTFHNGSSGTEDDSSLESLSPGKTKFKLQSKIDLSTTLGLKPLKVVKKAENKNLALNAFFAQQTAAAVTGETSQFKPNTAYNGI